MIEKLLKRFGYIKEKEWKKKTLEALSNVNNASISIYPDPSDEGKYIVDFDRTKIEIRSCEGDRLRIGQLFRIDSVHNSVLVSGVVGGVIRRVG